MNFQNQNLRVLVADGSPIVRKRLCHLVEETNGLSLAGEAEMAVEAFMLFISRRPDAVVTAVRMPDASGLQLLRRIKETAPDCLVIMLCDDVKEDYLDLCTRFGADHLFHKATEFEEVFAVLSRAAETARETMLRPQRDGRPNNETLCETTGRKP